MTDLNLLGPAIVGIVVGIVGLIGLIWMNRNRPILEQPADDEEAVSQREPER